MQKPGPIGYRGARLPTNFSEQIKDLLFELHNVSNACPTSRMAPDESGCMSNDSHAISQPRAVFAQGTPGACGDRAGRRAKNHLPRLAPAGTMPGMHPNPSPPAGLASRDQSITVVACWRIETAVCGPSRPLSRHGRDWGKELLTLSTAACETTLEMCARAAVAHGHSRLATRTDGTAHMIRSTPIMLDGLRGIVSKRRGSRYVAGRTG